MISGIERLLRPLRVLRIPSHDVAIMISMAFRFVPAFLHELQRIKEAQMARGADFRNNNLLQRVRATARLLPPLILSFLRRADDLAAAMEARGYQRGPRTYLSQLRISRADIAALLVMAMVAGSHLLLNHLSW
jgi:energy-coupling factor transporter transmembrane protein EcfT